MSRRSGFLLLFLLLLAASHLWRRLSHEPPPPGAGTGVFLARAVGGEGPVRMVYRLRAGGAGTPVLLLHGSPGRLEDFDAVLEHLPGDRPILVPSLPGFGRSQRRIPDHSVAAEAAYCLQLLEHLHLDRVHVVGFSLGGAVGLELYARAPEEVASLSLVSALGVQELELLGSYEMNHLLHGVQLALLWVARELLPHFGLLDRALLDTAYARSFYDTDQRPLREILRRFQPPALVVHGRDDLLVPWAAAREHHRLLPQSELVTFAGENHFLPFTAPERLAATLATFFDAVDAGRAPTRARADPSRLAAATARWETVGLEPARGLGLLLLVLLLVLGTFISEDLTCIAAGLLIAQGRLGWETGFLACFLGIYLGDQLLYVAGRRLGATAVRRRPWRWFVDEEGLRAAAGWFERRGMMVVVLSRFVPGTRLPTYLLAGAVRARYWLFALYFFVAVALWTPLLVGLAVVVGMRAARLQSGIGMLVLGLVMVLVLVRILLPACTHRGRRRLLGRWRRWTRWEFWPPWLLYLGVLPRLLRLTMAHRGFALVTAVNPGMEGGGFVNESKGRILEGLGASAGFVARTLVLPAGTPPEAAAERILAADLGWPLILKPDRGERGRGVQRVGDAAGLADALARRSPRADLLAQEYVEGPEYGILWCRRPGEAEGRIVSITAKTLPEVEGDGRRTLEELILDDPRAVILYGAYRASVAERLYQVPAPGERVRLVELGTHCRGAIFADGRRLETEALRRRIAAISDGYAGFYLGRYDLRAADEAALRDGRDFKILELNGLTSEPTHIYDPAIRLREAHRALGDHWESAFAIARANAAAGAVPWSHGRLLREVGRYLRDA